MYPARLNNRVSSVSRNSTIGVANYDLGEKVPVGRHSSTTGLGNTHYGGYDAMRDAETKFYQNPGKYSVSKRSSIMERNNDDYSVTKTKNERVSVVLEHWSGCIGKGVANDIKLALGDYFPDVKVTEFRGRVDSFEVFINGKLLYSRIMQGGYPYEDEVLDGVWRAKHGKDVFQVDRFGGSNSCTIL